MPFDLARRMEGASLDAGCGPDRARGLGEAASAIGDEHGGRGNPHHEGSPRLGAFALREMPGEDVASAAGDEDDGIATIHWLQSLQEPGFAMPVMDPLIVRPDYNPEVDDELLKNIGELQPDELLVMVTVTVPKGSVEKMTVNLKGPIVINAAQRLAVQVIVEGDEYQVKYPIYDILQKNRQKAGE